MYKLIESQVFEGSYHQPTASTTATLPQQTKKLSPKTHLPQDQHQAATNMISSIKAFTILSVAALTLGAPHALTTSSIHLSKRSCPGPSATILLQNQDSHASVQATICTDNLADDISAVFAGSAIDSRNGHFYVTSAHLLSYTDGLPAFCSFQNLNGDLFGRVVKDEPDLRNWVTPAGPGLVDMGLARIQCHVDKEGYYGCLGISGDAYTECVNKVTAGLNGNGGDVPPTTCA